VAALMLMVMMTFAMHMLVRMFPLLMTMLMAIMGMSHGLVVMLVLMFVFVMATHFDSPPLPIEYFYYNSHFIDVKIT
jgi:hypothetical protein